MKKWMVVVLSGILLAAFSPVDGIAKETQPAYVVGGMWFGTAVCIPSYLHYEADDSLSIYQEQ